MIDAIAVYGFQCSIALEKQPETKEEENKEDESWSNVDIRNLMPDTYSCIIKVSVAPNKLQC